jgi:uncharacterized cupin superfamily protein
VSDKTAIRVVKPASVVWSEASRNPEETDPPGDSFTAFEKPPFSVGFWQRDVQRRHFERPYHEIAYIIEGEVEITTETDEVVHARPGDVLITPQGSKGYWKSLSPVRKVWAIFEE